VNLVVCEIQLAPPLLRQVMRESAVEGSPDAAASFEDHCILSNLRLSFVGGCSRVVRADKGKPTERWGRKASGLQTRTVYDSGVASDKNGQLLPPSACVFTQKAHLRSRLPKIANRWPGE